MTSRSSRADGALRRHDLVFVSPAAWRMTLEPHAALAREALVADWVDRGWPLIVRRPAPGDREGVPVGLPLPPAHGKRRLAFVLKRDSIVSTAPPPLLDAGIDVAPPGWRPTLQRLVDLAVAYRGQARIYGSLAWSLLTGLDYLTELSDLDLLLPLPVACEVAGLTAHLAALERAAPMHLDGELVRDDGAGVNWRELHEGAPEVLVKTLGGATLLRVDRFIEERLGR
jgi:phosphoribosyl-dephospho-CoA transferase